MCCYVSLLVLMHSLGLYVFFVGPYAFLSVFIGPYASLSVFMGPDRSLCVFMGTYGFL